MRADRLLSILLFLQAHGKTTARDLARRLEASERTIHRDMEALSGAGIPVVAERGKNGGWYLLDSFSAQFKGFNLAEIQALALPEPAGLLTDLGLEHAAQEAFIKLLANLPAMQRYNAEVARQRIYVDTVGWFPQAEKEKVPLLPLLQEALWQDRKVEISYERGDGRQVERVVDPLGLVVMSNIWYFVAAARDQMRTYRVARMLNVRVTEKPCVRPEQFDLPAFWEQWKADYKADMPRYPAVLAADPAQIPLMRALWRYARIDAVTPFDPPDRRGWVKVAVTFEVADEACRYVLGCGPTVAILEPQELRDLVTQSARQLLNLYPHQV